MGYEVVSSSPHYSWTPQTATASKLLDVRGEVPTTASYGADAFRRPSFLNKTIGSQHHHPERRGVRRLRRKGVAGQLNGE
jgi:hypothetical protein